MIILTPLIDFPQAGNPGLILFLASLGSGAGRAQSGPFRHAGLAAHWKILLTAKQPFCYT